MLGQFAPFHCIASVGRAVRILWAAFFFIPAKVGGAARISKAPARGTITPPADVCKALEVLNPTDAIKKLDDDEKARFNLGLRGGETNIINEPGLYSLVLGSRKPDE